MVMAYSVQSTHTRIRNPDGRSVTKPAGDSIGVASGHVLARLDVALACLPHSDRPGLPGSLLYGVNPSDPYFIGVTSLLRCCGDRVLFSSHAALLKIDPVVALRTE